MLNSLAGGDALEIIVALKDLSSAGFTKLEGNLKHLEGTANATNMGGFSKATKTAEADAAKLAGSKGGGGIMGLASGMLSLAGGPVTLVAAGLAAAAGAGVLLTRTYDEVAQSEALLKAAGDAHGLSLESLNKHIDDNRSALEASGFTLADYRDATVKMTDANLGLAQQQAALNPIMALAKAHQLSLTDATRQYVLAAMGNQRATKDLGFILPVLTEAQKKGGDMTERYALVNAKLAVALGDTGKATTPLAVTQAKLSDAWEKLATAVGPAVEGFFTFLIGTVGTLIDVASTLAGVFGTVLGPMFDLVGSEIGHVADAVGFAADIFGNFVKGVNVAGAAIGGALSGTGAAADTFAGKAKDDLDAVSNATHDLQGKARDDLVSSGDSVTSSFADVGAAARTTASQVATQAAKIMAAADTILKRYVADATAMADGYFTPIEERWALHEQRVKIATDHEALLVAKGKEAQGAARAAIVQDLDDEYRKLVVLGGQHKLTAKDVANFATDAKANYKSLGADGGKHVNELLGKLRILAAMPDIGVNFTLRANSTGWGSMATPHGYLQFAEGGFVPGPRGAPQMAVVHGGEYVIPESGTRQTGGGGIAQTTTVVHTHIYLDGRTIAEVVDRHLGTTLSLRGSSRVPGLGGI